MSVAPTTSTSSLFQTEGKDRYKLTKNVIIEIGGNKYTLIEGTFLFSAASQLKIPMGYLVKMVNENKSYEQVHKEFEDASKPKIGPRTSYLGRGGAQKPRRRHRRQTHRQRHRRQTKKK